MPSPSYMQIKDSAGGNIFELKGWRWTDLLAREIKIHPTKSFPGASSINPPLGLDFGSHTRHYALQGKLNTQRQFNRLKLLAIVTWYDNYPVTLTIGTGGTKIEKTGVIEHVHVEWDAKSPNFMIASILFYDTTWFTV